MSLQELQEKWKDLAIKWSQSVNSKNSDDLFQQAENLIGLIRERTIIESLDLQPVSSEVDSLYRESLEMAKGYNLSPRDIYQSSNLKKSLGQLISIKGRTEFGIILHSKLANLETRMAAFESYRSKCKDFTRPAKNPEELIRAIFLHEHGHIWLHTKPSLSEGGFYTDLLPSEWGKLEIKEIKALDESFAHWFSDSFTQRQTLPGLSGISYKRSSGRATLELYSYLCKLEKANGRDFVLKNGPSLLPGYLNGIIGKKN